jgi:hypothetical protein
MKELNFRNSEIEKVTRELSCGSIFTVYDSASNRFRGEFNVAPGEPNEVSDPHLFR